MNIMLNFIHICENMMQKSLNNWEKVFGKSLCTEKVKYFFQPCSIGNLNYTRIQDL